MPDLLGFRAKIGVVVPSTNTTMEPEMHSMAPAGVTFHTARLYLAQSSIRSPQEAQKAAEAFQDALATAVRDVMTAEVDHLMVGVSALSFMGGVDGSQRFEDSVKKMANVPVTTAAAAATAALGLYGVKRIGILSPHPAMQVGTDLVATRLSDEAERWLGRPVLAVNAAMLWHALRALSIDDRLPGLGSILRTH